MRRRGEERDGQGEEKKEREEQRKIRKKRWSERERVVEVYKREERKKNSWREVNYIYYLTRRKCDRKEIVTKSVRQMKEKEKEMKKN